MPRRATARRAGQTTDAADTTARRAPFSDNPQVGARGQQAQQRILEAALRTFGEDGYERCSIQRITDTAGCSRAAFYQYFSSKEDVFRHLAGLVARQLTASAEALGPLTADGDGWASMRAWVERHGDVHDRYDTVFRVSQAAAERDDAIARGSARIQARNVAVIRSRLLEVPVPARHLDPVIALLLETMSRTHHIAALLRRTSPTASYPRRRIDDAITDVAHRTLTRFDADVNVHASARSASRQANLGTILGGSHPGADPALDEERHRDGIGAALLAAGHDELVARGYHGARIADITRAAGVSHGVFYRYFESKDQFVRLLAGEALKAVSVALASVPTAAVAEGPAWTAALRRWLRHYNTTYASEAAMIRVWVDAALEDPALGIESAAGLDWGRDRMQRFLAPRGFGDIDAESVVLLALLDAFGARRRDASTIDAAIHIVQRGLLGRT